MRLKNEVTVGVVVVLGILLAIVGAFWLSGKPFGEEQNEIVAVFREVGELRNGNPVKFRGVQVGRVTGIEIGEAGAGVLVTMQVSPTADLPADAAVLLAPASLFGDWQAAIVSPASYPEVEFTEGSPPEVLAGATLPDITQLTAVGARIAEDLQTLAQRVELAFTEETAIKMRETIDNVQQMSEQLTGFVDQQTQTYRDVSQNVLVAAEGVSRVATEVESAFSQDGQIQQILANAEQASQNLEQLSLRLEESTEGIPAMVARADTTLAEFGQLANSASALMDTLEPQVGEVGPAIAEARMTLASLQRVAARIEQGEGTLGRLMEDPALYEEMQATISSLRRILADIQANPARYIGEVRVF